MTEINGESNIVEALRAKTEETDMNQYLKKALGGYTKSSVLEYLGILRKQQQAMSDTFSHNQQLLFEEKESLKKENEALKLRLMQLEAENKNLTESMRCNALEEEEMSPSDIMALINHAFALEEEINKSKINKSQLENQINQLNDIVKDCSVRLEQSQQEKLGVKELLKNEIMESKKLRHVVAQLSGKVEEKETRIQYLNTLIYEGKTEELTTKIHELTAQLAAETDVVEKCNSEIALKAQDIETLTLDNKTLTHNLAVLTKALEELSNQNEKLLHANRALSEALENEYKKSIALIKEKSSITVDKLTAIKKLNESASKIALLELAHETQKNESASKTALLELKLESKKYDEATPVQG
ncbi:MAG: hypothetical protein AB7D36_11390 [Oscillospiraceae bacterium]